VKINSKRVIFTGAALVGLLNGAGFLYVEFQNNNQSEYFDTVTGRVDLPYAAMMFAVAAIPAFLFALLLGFVAFWFVRGAIREFRNQRTPLP
jgi:hypothetical protein